MKYCLFFCLLFTGIAGKAQDWYAELMVGGAIYNGDLSQKAFDLKRVGPATSLNLKYNTGDFVNLRAGFSYARLSGNDKYNKDPGLQSRNLNFQTNILELNLCAEFNILDPYVYYAYPYVFGGAGIFHFNPYTHDKQNNKTFLQPLGTEGQGLLDYPGRKKYSLYQVCFPVGGGFKLNLQEKFEIGIEFGYRLLLTDYLDDVSKTYVNQKALLEVGGSKAVELAYRKNVPFQEEGEKRGNDKVKDSYFFAGIKLGIKISSDDEYY